MFFIPVGKRWKDIENHLLLIVRGHFLNGKIDFHKESFMFLLRKMLSIPIGNEHPSHDWWIDKIRSLKKWSLLEICKRQKRLQWNWERENQRYERCFFWLEKRIVSLRWRSCSVGSRIFLINTTSLLYRIIGLETLYHHSIILSDNIEWEYNRLRKCGYKLKNSLSYFILTSLDTLVITSIQLFLFFCRNNLIDGYQKVFSLSSPQVQKGISFSSNQTFLSIPPAKWAILYLIWTKIFL